MSGGVLASCEDCVTSAWVLRRMGFRDSIAWGTLTGSPNTPLMHAFTSNSRLRDLGGKPSEVLPLCTSHRSELAWLSAGKPKRVTVYMAHPVAGNFHRNVASAICWLRWLRSRTPGQLAELTRTLYNQRPLILAPWLAGIEDIDDTPALREVAMRDNLDTVTMCDEVWVVRSTSPGIQQESGAARVVRDLTHLGDLPPGVTPAKVRAMAKKLETI